MNKYYENLYGQLKGSYIKNKFPTLADKEAEPFPSVIIREDFKYIYACSDLHGDILSLIVLLRDCAGVIRKKEGYGFSNHDMFDTDLDESCGLRVPISQKGLLTLPFDDKEYVHDLNYEWTAENVCVVIIGDMIDNVRRERGLPGRPLGKMVSPCDPLDPSRRFGEYIHEEVKLIAFINAMSKQARAKNSRIIKLMGNHELMNLLGEKEAYSPYISDFSSQHPIGGVSRDELFNKGNKGAMMLNSEGGMGAIVKIYDIVFVHGGIGLDENTFTTNGSVPDHKSGLQPYRAQTNNFEEDIKSLNCALTTIVKGVKGSYNCQGSFETHLQNLHSVSWNRYFGSVRIYTQDNKSFCEKVSATIKGLCGHDCQLRFVIGHCPQVGLDRAAETPYPIRVIECGTKVGTGKEHMFTVGSSGITASCAAYNSVGVDVAASRGMDHAGTTTYTINLPQLLCIEVIPQKSNAQKNYVFTVLRSTLANTLLHQPRGLPAL